MPSSFLQSTQGPFICPQSPIKTTRKAPRAKANTGVQTVAGPWAALPAPQPNKTPWACSCFVFTLCKSIQLPLLAALPCRITLRKGYSPWFLERHRIPGKSRSRTQLVWTEQGTAVLPHHPLPSLLFPLSLQSQKAGFSICSPHFSTAGKQFYTAFKCTFLLPFKHGLNKSSIIWSVSRSTQLKSD